MKKGMSLILGILIILFYDSSFSIDLNRYAGKWYEIAHIPSFFEKDSDKCTTAFYQLVNNNTAVAVNNSTDRNNQYTHAYAIAYPEQGTQNNNDLSVYFYQPKTPFAGQYHIVYVNSDNIQLPYSVAIIASNKSPAKANLLWFLARTPIVSNVTYQMLQQQARAKGYGLLVEHLRKTVQINCPPHLYMT